MRWPFVSRARFDALQIDRDFYHTKFREMLEWLTAHNAKAAESNARFAGQVVIAESKAMSVAANVSAADSKAVSAAAQVASWDALTGATD